MSIDGIGRPPAPKAPGALGELKGSSGAEPFRLEGGPSAPARATNDVSELLARLERGGISTSEYLSARVEEAVAPLVGRLSPEQIEVVREALRAELEMDPVLMELVRRATAGASATQDR